MKVLVTGGAGFIGFHTVQALLKRGDEVTIVDNFNTSYDPLFKKARVALFPKSEKLRVQTLDITNYHELEKVFQENSFDSVCHLAAQPGVRESLKEPRQYSQSNIVGTLNVLELCRQYAVKNFVFASSSSVYGKNKKIPFSESDTLLHPLSYYAVTKKMVEDLALSYSTFFGLNCTGLRFFTVYGPWGRPDMALFKFTKKILEGESINVYGEGTMFRDFTYIDDVVKGITAALDHPHSYEIFNIGSGVSEKLNDCIAIIEKYTEKTAEKNFLPIQLGDVKMTHADITKAQTMLNFQPKISLQEGLSLFVSWYRSHYKL